MKRDLTHREAFEAFAAFAKNVGAKCEASVMLRGPTPYGVVAEGQELIGFFRPQGNGASQPSFIIYAEDYGSMLAAFEAKWAEHAELHAANVERAMALAIITLTADVGECTDAALRATFSAEDIARYGERACAQATEMAGLGPFSIVTLAGANEQVAA
jgi:hypothetical protein